MSGGFPIVPRGLQVFCRAAPDRWFLPVWAGLALVCRRLVRRLQQASEQDVLTGLLNRRGIETRLHQQARLAARRGQRLSLRLIDAQHFKRINDKHCHPAGDAMLQAMGRVLHGVIRDRDLAARAGGE